MADHASLIAADNRHLWHPFTHMRQWMDEEQLVITDADGRKVKDATGNWYYDGHSSLWVNIHGHRVLELDAAITQQLGRIAHSTQLGLTSVPAIELAQTLSGMTGDVLSRVFFSDSGATAVEVALKIATQYFWNRGEGGEGANPQRHLILGFTNNYHGDTWGAMSVAADDLFHKPFLSRLAKHPKAEYPFVYRSATPDDPEAEAARCLAGTRAKLAELGQQVAAIIVEPVEGAGGIIPAPASFLRGLRELADEAGALLIVDEVATGFGRTGSLFAWQAAGCEPDILCVGKGLTGGYLPVAATLTRERIFAEFLGDVDSGRTLFHGHSYTGNQLGCSVALESCRLLQDRVLPTLPAKVELARDALADFGELPFVGNVRQAGLMVGIEMVADKATKRRFDYAQRAGEVVIREVRQHGMIIRPIGNTVIWMPPLASTEDELREMLTILRTAITAAAPALQELAAALES